MTDALIFIGVLGCLALVVTWYVSNLEAGAEGRKGLLAVGEAPAASDAPAYRIKARPLRRGRRPEKPAEAAPAYRARRTGRRAFAAKEAPGYRSTAPRRGEKSGSD
ncbi:MAG: hypothetical protein GC153_00775 [Alphaproteobacteria bacterium]|nr:hypothetical protein [Alphaproteobacteria bacterium]